MEVREYADYETAWALLADERDTAPPARPDEAWRSALLELAALALGFSPVTGLKLWGPTTPPSLERVNAVLGRVGIAPLVLRTRSEDEVRAEVEHKVDWLFRSLTVRPAADPTPPWHERAARL